METGEKFPCGGGELLVAVTYRGCIKKRYITSLDVGYLLIYFLPLPPQLGEPLIGIGLGAEDDLPQQLKMTFSRDSVPTNSRSRRFCVHCSAFSTAGVAS